MFHSEVFSSSIASGATTRAQVTYVKTNAILPPLNLGLQVSPVLNKLMFVAGVGAHMVQVQIQAPSQLPFPYTNMVPNNRGTAFESPPRVWDFSTNPLELRATEELDVFASQNAGAGETQYIMTSFTDGIAQQLPVTLNPPGYSTSPYSPGRFFTAHWTASTTLTAATWTAVTPAFDTALPAGTYAILGAAAFSATALFFRLAPTMGPLWKPGGVAIQTYDQMLPYNQRSFQFNSIGRTPWGIWLSFFQNVPPNVEFFATAGDTTEEGWFDMVLLSAAVTTGI